MTSRLVRRITCLTSEGVSEGSFSNNNPDYEPKSYVSIVAKKRAEHQKTIQSEQRAEPELIENGESRSTDPLKKNAGAVPLFETACTQNEFQLHSDTVMAQTRAGKKSDN
jgi:hypothetical protein